MNQLIELLTTFFATNITEIAWIIFLFFLAKIGLGLVIRKFVHLVDDGNDEFTSQAEQRAETLGQVVRSVGNAIIYAVLLFMILSLVGIDIRPILASAGIIGLAVGFGSQALVKDFVSGLFILLENHYSVGDVIKIGTFQGIVIRISMRSTALLNEEDGSIYHIANGGIKDVVNFSQHNKRNT